MTVADAKAKTSSGSTSEGKQKTGLATDTANTTNGGSSNDASSVASSNPAGSNSTTSSSKAASTATKEDAAAKATDAAPASSTGSSKAASTATKEDAAGKAGGIDAGRDSSSAKDDDEDSTPKEGLRPRAGRKGGRSRHRSAQRNNGAGIANPTVESKPARDAGTVAAAAAGSAAASGLQTAEPGATMDLPRPFTESRGERREVLSAFNIFTGALVVSALVGAGILARRRKARTEAPSAVPPPATAVVRSGYSPSASADLAVKRKDSGSVGGDGWNTVWESDEEQGTRHNGPQRDVPEEKADEDEGWEGDDGGWEGDAEAGWSETAELPPASAPAAVAAGPKTSHSTPKKPLVLGKLAKE